MQTKSHLHHWTPLFYSHDLSRIAGTNVWLKMDCFQPTGSFKIRGIGRLCQHYHDHNCEHFITSSAGNAGLSVAYAGRLLGVKTHVFIPKTSQSIFIEKIKAEGATVEVAGDTWDDADIVAQAYAAQENTAYIPPFDHPLIWSGHATMIDEIAVTGLNPDAIIAAVGGGGLACGVLEGLDKHGWLDTQFIGVETEGAAAFSRSLAANKLLTLDSVDTIATSIATKRITHQLIKWMIKRPLKSITVTDAQAIIAVKQFLDTQRILIEPASAVTLASIYEHYFDAKQYKNIVVIICGGVGINRELLTQYLQLQSDS